MMLVGLPPASARLRVIGAMRTRLGSERGPTLIGERRDPDTRAGVVESMVIVVVIGVGLFSSEW
jgi:hypothetical protein